MLFRSSWKVDELLSSEPAITAEFWKKDYPDARRVGYRLWVKPSRFVLTMIECCDKFNEPTNITAIVEAEFTYDQSRSLKLLIGKFLEWEAIASTNHVEDPFLKQIPVDSRIYPITQPEFGWRGEGGAAYLVFGVDDKNPSHINNWFVDKKQAQGLLGLLEKIPAMQEELAQKTRNREKQMDSFQ